jgi:hypothetical protein
VAAVTLSNSEHYFLTTPLYPFYISSHDNFFSMYRIITNDVSDSYQ